MVGEYFCDLIFSGLSGVPKPGAEFFADGLTMRPGGCYTSALALTRLGVASAWAADFGTDNIIAFTGYAATDPDDPKSEVLTLEEGAKNCVEGFKKVVGYAEKKGVTISLELLNTTDDTHPMKGHPGYQGDKLAYCIDILQRVGSPRLKLLFDIYHVQIQDGDIIRNLRKYKDYIGHIHTAGNPGRGEVFGGAMTGTQLISICLVIAGGIIWWLRPGMKAVPAPVAR